MFYFNPPPLTELASGCRVADYDDDDACDFVVTWVVAEDAEKMMRLRRSRRLISHLAAAASTLSPADAEDASVAAIYQLLLPQADAGLPQADA